MERIAAAVVGTKMFHDPHQKALATHLRVLLSPYFRTLGLRVAMPRRLARRSEAAHLILADYPRGTVKSLLQCVKERAYVISAKSQALV